MDFSFGEEELAVAEAADGVFGGLATPERVAEVERTGDRFDGELWEALAAADLLGLAVPVEHGGQGLGLTALCLLLEALGRRVAPVPLWATTVLGALPLARFAAPTVAARWLPEVAAGRAVLTAALTGTAESATGTPPVTACPATGSAPQGGGHRDGGQRGSEAAGGEAGSGGGAGGWVLDGTELAVPQAHLAARILVPARTPDGGVLLALVDPAATGVRLERAVTTNRQIHPHLHLSNVVVGPDDVVAGPGSTAGVPSSGSAAGPHAAEESGVGAPDGPGSTAGVGMGPHAAEESGVGAPDGLGSTAGAAALRWTLEAAWTGLAALAVGVCESALAQAADYLNQREQFGRPLSAFQGTMLRAADAAIDIEAMRVTLWQAAWRIDTGRSSAEAVAVAKWQAAERGQRVVHATQHLHGGVGADVTYPIHRYFLWGKQIELLLGGPSRQLARLGGLLAERYAVPSGPPGGRS